MNILNEQLRKKRLEKGLQQKDMASALKISPPAYSKIESGQTRVNIELAQKIAEILEISLAELVEGKPSNYEIKNGDNSPLNLAAENSTLIMQNDKLIETQNKLAEQMIGIMQNQNDLFKEMIKLMKQL
jgi:transcriptional regulator with XRE-family HTH domain